MPERFAVAVIEAGLVTSHHLPAQRIEHVVFEHGRMGETWHSRRWDSFTFVAPNWRVQLPGHPYYGHDPVASCHVRRPSVTPNLTQQLSWHRCGSASRTWGWSRRVKGGFRLHLLLTGD